MSTETRKVNCSKCGRPLTLEYGTKTGDKDWFRMSLTEHQEALDQFLHPICDDCRKKE